MFKIFRHGLLICCALLLACCSAPSFNAGKTTSTPTSQPKNITLLVPLQGANGSSGQAIRNGFLAAYYYAKQTQPNAPTVNVVDSSSGNVTALYQQAVANGADFVVGPLTKPEVQAIAAQGQLSVPTLALNTLDNAAKPIANLYQFGLSPQDEAQQVATRAKKDGHSRALIIVPAGNWGADVAKVFAQQWQQLGGSIAGNYTYSSRQNMTTVVRNALGVTTTDQRAAPQARSDVDMIFLVAFPPQARQIKPLLMYYAATIPVYATSLIYGGTPSAQDHDLDGILFTDMPWIIGPDAPVWSQIRTNIQTLWASSYNRSPRLYALGIDAYHLTYALNRLSSGVDGATGKLTLDGNQRVRRQLEWAKMQNGTPEHQ